MDGGAPLDTLLPSSPSRRGEQPSPTTTASPPLQGLEDGEARVQGLRLVLFKVVGHDGVLPQLHRARPGFLQPQNQSEEGGLAGAWTG